METTQNTYRMADVPQAPTMENYFGEELEVRLTRREVWFLRDIIKKRIMQARQAMGDPKTHPQRKRARYEEFTFLRGIQERLYGSDPDGEEERAAFLADLGKQADEMEAKAAEIRELAKII